MNIVIDANIIFAALIKDSKTAEIILNKNITLYTPEFVLLEIEKHKKEILEKTSRSKEELEQILNILKYIIKIIPQTEIEQYLAQSRKITPDPNDIMYIALALKLKCAIWSNDKVLATQNQIKVHNTAEIIKLLE